MPDVWTFGPSHDEETTYSDGTVVPGRSQNVYLNGQKVGYLEIHMHKRRGDDRVTDASFGITACIFGPFQKGAK